jgi:hypothetical protein
MRSRKRGRSEIEQSPRNVSQVSDDDRTKLGRELRRPAAPADFVSSLIGA